MIFRFNIPFRFLPSEKSTYLNKLNRAYQQTDIAMHSVADPGHFKCSDHPSVNRNTNFFGTHSPYFLITKRAVARMVFSIQACFMCCPPPRRGHPLIGWQGTDTRPKICLEQCMQTYLTCDSRAI